MNALATLSLVQALDIWSELEMCYYDDNAYGGNIAEIYAYRLLPNMPAQNVIHSPEMDAHYREDYRNAAQALVDLCNLFMKERVCHVDIEDLAPDKWLALGDVFDHRVHVEVWRD